MFTRLTTSASANPKAAKANPNTSISKLDDSRVDLASKQPTQKKELQQKNIKLEPNLSWDRKILDYSWGDSSLNDKSAQLESLRSEIKGSKVMSEVYWDHSKYDLLLSKGE